MKKISLLLLLAVFAFSCQNDDDDSVEPDPIVTMVNPENSNALASVLVFPSGTQVQAGNVPQSSESLNAPIVTTNATELISSNGSTTPLSLSFSNVDESLGGCYVQIDGAGTFVTIPYEDGPSNEGDLQVPIGIPNSVTEGTFTINYCVYDINGLVSNVVSTTINVLRLGTGNLQISLSWDSATDQDLYVTDPIGTTIYYANLTSISGGRLDRDDLDGFGPENIFWTDTAPDGQYSISVNDFEGTSTPNNFIITVTGANDFMRTFNGSTINGSTEEVATFIKSGDNIIFQ